jgi:hypothetical protein
MAQLNGLGFQYARGLPQDTARVFIWDLFPDTGDDCELKLSSGKVVKVRAGFPYASVPGVGLATWRMRPHG